MKSAVSILLLGVEDMEWVEPLNSAVNYIEENIKETIDLEEYIIPSSTSA